MTNSLPAKAKTLSISFSNGMRDTAFHQISPRSIFFFQPGGMFPPRFIVVRTYPELCHAGMRFQKGLNGQHRKADSAAPARLLRAGCVKTRLTLHRSGSHTAQAYLPLLFLPERRTDGVCRRLLHSREKNLCSPQPRTGRISRFIKAHKNTVRAFPFCCLAVCAIDAGCLPASLRKPAPENTN